MDTEPDAQLKAKTAARDKLLGRAMVIGFLALVAVYAAVTFWPH